MSEGKRLLFVINTLGRAGAETALMELLKRLSALKRYEIDLFAIIPRGELFSRVPEGVRILNRRYTAASVLSSSARLAIARQAAGAFFGRGRGFRLLGQMLKSVSRQKKEGRVQMDKVLWRLLSEGAPVFPTEYDLAVAYIEGASAYYVADRVRARRKAAFIHIDYQQAGYKPWMDGGCYGAYDKIFTVSREVGNKFLEVYPEHRDKVEQCNNLLDAEGIRRKAREPGFQDDFRGIRLVTVGRLHYQKGYDIAVEACALLRQRGCGVRWYVIGEGAERANLEKLIKEKGLEDTFLLLGVRENPYPYMRQADIYVHATRFEGKSIAIDEAQILGKPIVASNCTGNTEQITDGEDGLLVDLTAENLAAALERVIEDGALRRRLAEKAGLKARDGTEDLNKILALIGDTADSGEMKAE